MTYAQGYRAALQNASKIARLYLKSPEAAEAIAERIECLPVPEDAGDMVMVPREPTEKMIEKARYTLPGPIELCDADLEDIYITMIEAAGGKP